MPPLSLSPSHTHTRNNREKHQQASISFWEWKINQFLSFSLSIIQFHNLDHNVGNLDGVQIADKASFLVYFLFFQLL